MYRFALIFSLVAANQVAGQTLAVSIETIDPTEEGFISYCNFSGTIQNTGTKTANEIVMIDHRLRDGTFSAMTVPPSNGGNPISVSNLTAGASAPYSNSMLGVDCEDLDGVNFSLKCEGICEAILVATSDGVLPIQIDDEAVVGSDLIERGPLYGTWQVTGADGQDLMTLEVDDTPGRLTDVDMIFRRGADYCTVATAYCDETPMEIKNDRIYLQDDGEVRATIFVAGTSHRIHWDFESGIGTFFDMQRGWDRAEIIVTRVTQ